MWADRRLLLPVSYLIFGVWTLGVFRSVDLWFQLIKLLQRREEETRERVKVRTTTTRGPRVDPWGAPDVPEAKVHEYVVMWSVWNHSLCCCCFTPRDKHRKDTNQVVFITNGASVRCDGTLPGLGGADPQALCGPSSFSRGTETRWNHLRFPDFYWFKGDFQHRGNQRRHVRL